MALIKKLGWKRDESDPRDADYAFKPMVTKLPASVDLESSMPPVFDQGNLGSCTAHAILGADGYLQNVKNKKYVALSRLFLYYNERLKEGDVHSDNGAQIRTGMKVLNKIGCPQELLEPYIEADFSMKPDPRAYEDAKNYESISYHRVMIFEHDIKSALAQGFPVIFGFDVYDSFMSDEVARTGILSMPKHGEQMQGSHAVVMVGYDDAKQMFKVRNSWGKDWGIGGYFWMPYAYACDRKLCSDFWIIQSIKNTLMDKPTLHTKEQLAAMDPAQIIALIEAGTTWLLNTISTTGPLLHWRKEEQEEIDAIKQQVAAASKLLLNHDARLAAIEKQLGITPAV